MNKATITFGSKRSLELYDARLPSGKHHIHIVLGKICDIYYRGYHLSQLELDRHCSRYIKWLNGKSQRQDVLTVTLKFSNPIDSALLKLIRRYDMTMTLIDALVSEGKWDEKKANREARNIARELKSVFRFFMQMGLNKTHTLNKDDKAHFQLAKRSGIMPNISRFGFGARPGVRISRKKKALKVSQNACKEA